MFLLKNAFLFVFLIFSLNLLNTLAVDHSNTLRYFSHRNAIGKYLLLRNLYLLFVILIWIYLLLFTKKKIQVFFLIK